MKSFNKMHPWLFVILIHLICSSLTSGDVVFPCVTPDEEHSYCVSLFSCPHLMKSLSTLNPGAIDYVRKSVCLGCEAGDVMVCCGSSKKFTEATTTTTKPPEIVPSVPEVDVGQLELEMTPLTVEYEPPKMDPASVARRDHVKAKLLPSQRICGQQHTDDYVYEKNETALDEFPWMAQLVLAGILKYDYNFHDHTSFCSGVLITNRYILTDRYCALEALNVRLGQYSTHENISCAEESSLFVQCTERVVIRKVVKRIIGGETGQYYPALIKLNAAVDFSDYIRPICLPIDGSKRPTSEDYLSFSGFGASHDNDITKKRLTYNLTSSQFCYDAEDYLQTYIERVQVSLACLKPPIGNTFDACYGDHGGPLMYKHKHKWFADAIIVEVLGSCSATAPVSGIFITPSIMEWILDNIED